MKTLIYNMGYFLKEVIRTIRFNPLSNLFSTIGTALILFLLGLVIAGWSIGDNLIEALGDQAEISAYFTDAEDEAKALELVEQVKALDGVKSATYIDAEDAHSRMEKLLGEEAELLTLFEENPFEAYIEIRIDLNVMDTVLKQVGEIDGIEYVRDNREVLEQMKGIMQGLKLLGTLILAAVGITTLIIISHMIRQGIYNNREQINTLRLLGAPEMFIGLPFVLTGVLLTILGGALATVVLLTLIQSGYRSFNGLIPFIPLPPRIELMQQISAITMGISLLLGLLGSWFGVSSIKKDGNGSRE